MTIYIIHENTIYIKVVYKIKKEANVFKKLLRNEISTLGINLNEEQIIKMVEFCELIKGTAYNHGFTNIYKPEEISSRHIGESLFLLNIIDRYYTSKQKNISLIDIGTGIGVPGIPIQIASDNIKCSLLEPNKKRAKFLNIVKENTKLKTIEIINNRAENIGQMSTYRSKFDIAIAKAVAPLNVLLEYAIPLLKINGLFFAPKGTNSKKEISEINTSLTLLNCELIESIDIDTKTSNQEQVIIIFKKIKETPLKYPRRDGVPAKKPL